MGKHYFAQLIIKSLKAGEVIIVITPHCLYDKEITVKVYSESVLFNPKSRYDKEKLIRLLNGQENNNVTAILRNHREGDENLVKWNSSNPLAVLVSPTEGHMTIIFACSTGKPDLFCAIY